MALVMSTTFMITSSHRWYQLPYLHASIILLVFTIFHTNIVSCSATPISYGSHCASIVLESTPTDPEFTTLPFVPLQNGYYNGGDKILYPKPSQYYSSSISNVFLFRTQNVHKTNKEGVFRVEGMLILDAKSIYSYRTTFDKNAWGFKLHGFWSESTGKLCMVGSSFRNSQEGNKLDLAAVFKFNDVKNMNNLTSLIRGTLESLSPAHDSSYFEPISLLIFPQTNYQYAKVNDGCAGMNNDPKSLSLKLSLNETICSILSRPVNAFELEYASGCNSGKSCNPFGEGKGSLPRVVCLNSIQCSQDRQSLRLLIDFPNSSYINSYLLFNPNTTFIGEGTWDRKKNRLCVVACRLLDASSSWNNSHVGDCSLRLSLRFPAVWSIGNTSTIVGQIWSDSGFFNRIMFHSYQNNDMNRGLPGLKYEYTKIDRERNSCLNKKLDKNKHGKYPDGKSYEMQFDMPVKNSKGKIGWGYSYPVFVGNQIFQQNQYPGHILNPTVEAKTSSTSPLNISYKIGLTLLPGVELGGGINPFKTSSDLNERVDILAEGLYDAETGCLCMVGCRYLGSSNEISKNYSMDCEIRVNLQFPPLNPMKNAGRIKGSIESRREYSDPLYFEPLHVSGLSNYSDQAEESISRMDLGIIIPLGGLLFAAVIYFQQRFGGRCFLPRRFRELEAYEKVPGSTL